MKEKRIRKTEVAVGDRRRPAELAGDHQTLFGGLQIGMLQKYFFVPPPGQTPEMARVDGGSESTCTHFFGSRLTPESAGGSEKFHCYGK